MFRKAITAAALARVVPRTVLATPRVVAPAVAPRIQARSYHEKDMSPLHLSAPLYTDADLILLIDHYSNPRNVGSMNKNDAHVGTGLVGAPACMFSAPPLI